MNNFGKIILGLILAFIILKTCSDSSSKSETTRRTTQRNQPTKVYQKTALDELIRDLNAEPNFSIVLYDMDFEENTVSKDVYRHMYQVIIPAKTEDGEVTITKQPWKEVPATFFQANAENMGMEVASKTNGKLSKVAAPAGYSQYVGNEQYGRWNTRSDGSSFWEFYGKYAMLKSVFNIMSPVDRRYYNDYRGGYYGTSRPYYGSTGGPSFGTRSTISSRGSSSTWSSTKQNTFKSRVNSSVSRSTSQPTRRKATTTSSSSTRRRTTTTAPSSTSRTSRSSSRYSSSSSSRSRSGGFGK